MSNSRVVWLTPDDPPNAFPELQCALNEPDGLLAAGGDLSASRLLYAYRHGIFPWYDDGQPILWWSPDPRCVMQPKGYHLSRRLSRKLRNSTATLTCNNSFEEVVRACAGPRRSEQDTWITSAMADAYTSLHFDGWAHSIEVWQEKELIGGIYGLAMGKVFFGESMFSYRSDASKIALLGLTKILSEHDFALLDCQVVSSHLLTIGATTMSRRDFQQILEFACDPAIRFEKWPNDPINVPELCPEP